MRTATQEESELIQSTFGEFEAMIRGRLHGYIAHTVIAAVATALFILAVSSVAAAWICGEAGWVLAEVGRQPWVIQNLMPTNAAISGIQPSSVQLTFWIFALVFTALLIAEVSIMLRYISRASKSDIATNH